MRRLPGPAIRPLCEGGHTPEAHHELFRDWQRTQTQSSATALRSLRLQIDVWFCSRAGITGQEATNATAHPDSLNARAPERATDTCAFRLTLTYIDVAYTEIAPNLRSHGGGSLNIVGSVTRVR